MNKTVLKYMSIAIAMPIGMWCLYHFYEHRSTHEEIKNYMDLTDFYIAGKVTWLVDYGGEVRLYKMECDTMNIRNQCDERCFWGVCDTAKKIVYFHSYILNSDYVYIDSRKKLITANPVDTVPMERFRIFELSGLRRNLKKCRHEGTILF